MEIHRLWNDGVAPSEEKEDEITLHVVTLRAHLQEHRLSQGREFVEVKNDYIYVGIDCETIDNEAISQAFEMIGKLPNYHPGTLIELGQLVHINERQQTHSGKRCH